MTQFPRLAAHALTALEAGGGAGGGHAGQVELGQRHVGGGHHGPLVTKAPLVHHVPGGVADCNHHHAHA